MSSIQLTLILIIGLVLACALLAFGVARVLKHWSRGKPPVDLTLSLTVGGGRPSNKRRLPKPRQV